MHKKAAGETLATIRIEEKKIKSEAGKLGPETKAVIPDELEVMYLGKLCLLALEFQTVAQNTVASYKRAYDDKIDEELEEKLSAYAAGFAADFEAGKIRSTKIIKAFPLAKRLCQIKGFTEYQLGIIMAFVKDVERFQTPSALCTYAGVVPKNGLFISKANIHELRKIKHEQYTGDPEEFTEFGYNTRFQGRMKTVIDCLLRAGGWFTNEFRNVRTRLTERAMTRGECYLATAEDVKAGRAAEANRYYMKDRKKQSLEAWSMANARWRMGRILLHLVWTEWMIEKGKPPRAPYAIEYLGHQRVITLEEVVSFEKKK